MLCEFCGDYCDQSCAASQTRLRRATMFAELAPTSEACALCGDGSPVAFAGGAPACEKCVQALHEAGSRFDTVPCGPPDSCEAA